MLIRRSIGRILWKNINHIVHRPTYKDYFIQLITTSVMHPPSCDDQHTIAIQKINLLEGKKMVYQTLN